MVYVRIKINLILLYVSEICLFLMVCAFYVETESSQVCCAPLMVITTFAHHSSWLLHILKYAWDPLSFPVLLYLSDHVDHLCGYGSQGLPSGYEVAC